MECPNCKSQKVVDGRLAEYMRSTPVSIEFIPGALKWYQFNLEGGAELKPEAFACADCGMVWTSAAYLENLKAIIGKVTKKPE